MTFSQDWEDSDLMGRFETEFKELFAEAKSQFEKQFLSSKDAQNPEFWLKVLGESCEKVRDEADRLTPEAVSVEGVIDLIVGVAKMAALADFYLATFKGVK